jgi:Protein of unknown function (DUF4087)
MLNTVIFTLFISSLVSSASAQEQAKQVQTRCGWFSNPTPGNAWLQDKDAQWIIGTQGGHQAEGSWPDFKPSQWIKTNGNYGRGCACIKGTVDAQTNEVQTIISAYARPLAVCRKDHKLKVDKGKL